MPPRHGPKGQFLPKRFHWKRMRGFFEWAALLLVLIFVISGEWNARIDTRLAVMQDLTIHHTHIETHPILPSDTSAAETQADIDAAFQSGDHAGRVAALKIFADLTRAGRPWDYDEYFKAVK
jgi:hypothetical protein